MNILISLFGISLLLLGTLLAITPYLIKTILEKSKSNTGVAVAVLTNLILGTLFILAAPQSPQPDLIRVLGIMVIIKSVIILLRGRRRDTFIKYIQNLQEKEPIPLRMITFIWATFSGLLIIYLSGWPPLQ
jgi:hypothetical protein